MREWWTDATVQLQQARSIYAQNRHPALRHRSCRVTTDRSCPVTSCPPLYKQWKPKAATTRAWGEHLPNKEAIDPEQRQPHRFEFWQERPLCHYHSTYCELRALSPPPVCHFSQHSHHTSAPNTPARLYIRSTGDNPSSVIPLFSTILAASYIAINATFFSGLSAYITLNVLAFLLLRSIAS